MSTFGRKAIGTVGYMGGLMAVPEAWAWSYGQMVQYNAEYLVKPNEMVHYSRATVSFHSAARNWLAQQMLGDWLLMLDTDHVFDPDLCARMLRCMDENGIDVLSGLYCHKGEPHMPVIYGEQDGKLRPLADWDKPGEKYLIKIASAGAGCLMVRRSVFSKIRDAFNCEPFDVEHPYGEDHSFFRRLQKIGVEAYCNPLIESYHLAVQPVMLSDFESGKDNLTLEKLAS